MPIEELVQIVEPVNVLVTRRIGVGFAKVQFHRVEPDHDERRTAFITNRRIALLDIGVDENLFGAFRAN
jgi:hypothetical protein